MCQGASGALSGLARILPCFTFAIFLCHSQSTDRSYAGYAHWPHKPISASQSTLKPSCHINKAHAAAFEVHSANVQLSGLHVGLWPCPRSLTHDLLLAHAEMLPPSCWGFLQCVKDQQPDDISLTSPSSGNATYLFLGIGSTQMLKAGRC